MASTALKLALATSAVVGAWLLGYGDGRAAASRIYSEDLLRQHRAQNVTGKPEKPRPSGRGGIGRHA